MHRPMNGKESSVILQILEQNKRFGVRIILELTSEWNFPKTNFNCVLQFVTEVAYTRKYLWMYFFRCHYSTITGTITFMGFGFTT